MMTIGMSLMMLLMMGGWLIVPLLLIGAAAYILRGRQPFNQAGPAPSSQTPLEILEARYTRGEVSREAYEQMQRDLEG